MRRNLWISAGIAAVGLVLSAALYSKMPNPMPIHWNAAGQADGFAPRWLGLTLMPVVSLGVTGLLALVGRGMNDKPKAQDALAKTSILMALFNVAVHGMILKAALTAGFAISMGFIMGLMGALFAGLGVMMPSIEQNKWMGVRTPWTLADEVNWKLTHKIAGYTMVAGGVLAMFVAALPLAPEVLFGVTFTAIMIGALAPVAASYVIHREAQKRSR